MSTRLSAHDGQQSHVGTWRRLARALTAQWVRATHLSVTRERNSWSEALRFPYF
jgi:hypothetical protein